MKVLIACSFAALLCSMVTALDADIDELSLNYNQIISLMASFSNENLIKAVNFSLDSTEKSKFHENRIFMKAKIKNGSISHAQLIESLPDDEAKAIDRIAQDILKASSYLLNMYCKSSGISNKDCVKFMSRYSLPETSILSTKCLSMNLYSQTYRRLLPATYKDGLDKIRVAISGKDLPLPRVISNILFTTGLENIDRRNENKIKPATHEGLLDRKLSLSVAQWTQFIEHDLSRSVTRSMVNGAPIECCDQESVPIQPRYLHQSCQPLMIPSDDPHFRPLRVTCLNYVRSAIGINECKFGTINQLNQATNRLDLSQLYGTDDEDQDKIRSFHQGSLLASTDDSSILPRAFDELCFAANENSTCYHSGDSRVNANPFVTTIYTIFLRSHNQIAQKLRRMNPRWDDNQLFTVAKGINTAIYQKFIYNDWANVVLGKRMAMDVRNVDGKQYRSDKVSNEFGAAAIRFYNTMLPGDLMSYQDEPARSISRSSENIIEATDITSSKRKEILKLQDSFYKPRDLGKHNLLDQVMNAVLRQRSMAMDSSYVDDLSLQLYRSKMFDNKIFGGDSLALDIQRTRDHGLQPYINYIKKCLNIRIAQWDDLRIIISADELIKLKSIYDSVQDIDLIIGGLSETPLENGTLGPTFACILSDQLISSKVSDKHFYTRRSANHGEKISKTVEKYSAARFICDNTKLKKVQRNIFQVPSNDNLLIECSDFEQLPKLDLSYWLLQS